MTNTESARILFAQQCDFVLAAAEEAHFPKSTLPEIAFIGRSNVGKSSLINALTGRKNLARTSSTPGRTQQIVFFNLGERLMLVDLPGYGHAKAPHAEKDHWNVLMRHYLHKRPMLRCIVLLIDGRHGVMANDFEMMEFLDRAAVSYQTVLTKIDSVNTSERKTRQQQTGEILKKHTAARATALGVSADKNLGIEELRAFLFDFALPNNKG